MNRFMDRRVFGLTALTATVPVFLQKTGLALAGDSQKGIAPLPGLKDDHVLVIVQLAGGNDGLNTIIPHANDDYYRSRPKIAIEKGRGLTLSDTLALHPEMRELHKAWQDGQLAVVTNVGYPNPSRSHFRSMDIWETADTKIAGSGWVGRYFDNECQDVQGSMLGLRVGEQAALTFASRTSRASTFANPAMLAARVSGPVAKALDRIDQIEPTKIEALDFLQRTGNETRSLARRLTNATKDEKGQIDYPPFLLCQSLRLVAQMIAAEIPTRVYYVTLGGFDTHSAQTNRHAGLLQELSQALGLFRQDLNQRGHWDRTLVMTFSEFGRRIDENQQQGTDHGTANVMFLTGGKVKAGIHGAAPDLTDRDEQGDLKFCTDFRSVYASVLKDWLHADPTKVLGAQFEPVPVVNA